MGEDDWQTARLIPTSGINGQQEAERRATSALLAVMGAVREFGTAVTKPLGAPAGPLATYIEVPFALELGADVQVVMSRKEAGDFRLRVATQARSLVGEGRLAGTLRIPAAIAPIDVLADLRSGQVTVSIDVDAPREGRPLTRINWLLRQLKDAPSGLRIDAYAIGSRVSTSELLGVVREDPALLLDSQKREPRMFRIAAASPVGPKRGTGRGGFIDSVLAAVDGFYVAVVQQIQPWSARAPQLPRAGHSALKDAGVDIAPPPLDLEEPRGLPTVPPAPMRVDPDLHREEIGPSPVEEPRVPTSTFGIVSWDAAQDRLDRERAHDTVASEDLATPGP